MNIADEKAWKCLKLQEQQSLSLSITYGKSTWEVGEILGITHYKYLELKERAEKLFKLFFEYFSIYNTLVRPNSCLDQRFVDFVEGCIERRITRKEASVPFGDAVMKVYPIKSKFIIKQMKLLTDSEENQDKDLYKLLQEFDRWNNWRILPRQLQQPSAFKRRNNRRDIFYIKYMCRIEPEIVQNLIDKFWYSRKKFEKHYFVLFNYDRFDEGYQIVPIKQNSEFTLSELSRLYIYVFKDRDIADTYGYLVTSYQYEKKSPKKGQNFWPVFRETIQKAINYKEVNNLDFYCEKLDMAYENKDWKLLRKSKKRKEKLYQGQKRASDTSLYIK